MIIPRENLCWCELCNTLILAYTSISSSIRKRMRSIGRYRKKGYESIAAYQGRCDSHLHSRGNIGSAKHRQRQLLRRTTLGCVLLSLPLRNFPLSRRTNRTCLFRRGADVIHSSERASKQAIKKFDDCTYAIYTRITTHIYPHQYIMSARGILRRTRIVPGTMNSF